MNARSRGMLSWRRAVAVAGTVGIVAGVLALCGPTASAVRERTADSQSAASVAQTTRVYVIRFWPRWISWAQQAAYVSQIGPDQLIGPASMGPQFRIINAINDDT